MVLYRTICIKPSGDMEIRCYETLRAAYAACVPMDLSRWHIKMYTAVKEELESINGIERNVSRTATLVSYDEAPLTMEWFIQEIHQGPQSPLPAHFLRPVLVHPQT